MTELTSFTIKALSKIRTMLNLFFPFICLFVFFNLLSLILLGHIYPLLILDFMPVILFIYFIFTFNYSTSIEFSDGQIIVKNYSKIYKKTGANVALVPNDYSVNVEKSKNLGFDLRIISGGKTIILNQCSYRSSDWKRLLEYFKNQVSSCSEQPD